MERIYQYVYEQTYLLTSSQLALSGVTTNEVAEALAIQRTNASKDLNELVRQDRLVKLEGRTRNQTIQTTRRIKYRCLGLFDRVFHTSFYSDNFRENIHLIGTIRNMSYRFYSWFC